MMRLGFPPLLSEKGLTQHTELAERKRTFTPSSIIFLTLSYWRISQYSSCPTLIRSCSASRSGEHVAVGAVGYIVALLLQPEAQRKLPAQELAGTD